MARYQVAYKASTKEAFLQAYGDATLSGAVNIGDFYHDGGGVDALDPVSDNHVLYHDIQDICYRNDLLNMQDIKIKITRVTSIESSVADAAMHTGSDTTEQISTVFTPATASNRTLSYSSSNPAVATVSASGLITAVGAGSCVITVTAEDGGATDTVAITVSA